MSNEVEFAQVGGCFSVPITIRNKTTGQTFTFKHMEAFHPVITDELNNLLDKVNMSEWVEMNEDALPQSISSTDTDDWDFQFSWNKMRFWDAEMTAYGNDDDACDCDDDDDEEEEEY